MEKSSSATISLTDPLEETLVPAETIGKIPFTNTPTELLENKYPLYAITQYSECKNSESGETTFEPANPNLLISRGRSNALTARFSCR